MSFFTFYCSSLDFPLVCGLAILGLVHAEDVGGVLDSRLLQPRPFQQSSSGFTGTFLQVPIRLLALGRGRACWLPEQVGGQRQKGPLARTPRSYPGLPHERLLPVGRAYDWSLPWALRPRT